MKIPNDRIAGPWITDYERELVAQMMKDGWDNYKYVERAEEEFADWIGRKYCLLTPCCTHAIHLSLLALGIGPGDEVIVPECTWTGSIAPIVYCGATPIMADINERWCLPAYSTALKITGKTKAIIAVDLYGNMPYLGLVQYYCKDVPIIEDAAEGIGSKYNDDKAGSYGLVSCFSFHRTKTITTLEGGAFLTDDDELYQKAKILRDLGRDPDDMFCIIQPSVKYMPTNWIGAMLLGQLHRVDELVSRKREILHRYMKNLKGYGTMNQDDDIVYNGAWASVIVFDKVKYADIGPNLNAAGIPTRPFFYPLSSQPAYSRYAPILKNKNAYDISSRGLVLPSAYHITNDEQDYICEQIIKEVK